ncbi:pyocin knob domain-containing protein [Bradyrhizobium sp.]|uniref:pyocin knob domain-containing protein n=1 Tax=Bradyrhizobium sp. TaxID=376 RepID=UPI0039E6C27B
MAFVPPKDRVLEHSTSNSQTVFAVTGALDISYNAFSASMSVGDTTIGAVVEPGVAFKSGVLTYSAANQITVSTVLESKGTFSASGVKEVFMGQPAARSVSLDGAQTLSASLQSQGRKNLGVYVDEALPNGQDFNSVTNSGTFYTSDTTATNTPNDSVGSYWWLEVIYNGSYVKQTATPYTAATGIASSSVFVRTCIAGTWRPWRRLNSILRGYIDGLTLSTAGSSSTFAVAAGVATDSTAYDSMELASSISKTTSAWAVGSGNGGLDTGSIATNTWYHVHLIKRVDTGVVDALVSLSPTSPTMPTNYTLARRIGSMKTNGSSQWTQFTQMGEEFLWTTPVVDYTISATIGTTASSLSLSVPTGIKVLSNISADAQSSSTAFSALFSSLDTADTAPATNGIGYTWSQSIAAPLALNVRTNTSGQIRARATASVSCSVMTLGWFDRRGRDG